MIRAVIFDFGNVISTFDVGIVLRALAPYSRKNLGDLEAAMFASADLFTRFEAGLVEPDEFFLGMVKAGELTMSKKEFKRAFTQKFTPVSGTAEIIRRLKPDYKLGLLSNTNIWDYEEHITRQDVLPLFDSITLSFEVHVLKPDKVIYRDALSKLAVSPEEAVYIDDTHEYVAAAEELGMKGIHYRSDAGLRDALGEMQILPNKRDGHP